MIEKEAWHAEVAGLEEERERLYRAVQDKQITPEEFTHRMLRMWKPQVSEDPRFDLLQVVEWPAEEGDPLPTLLGMGRLGRNGMPKDNRRRG